MRSPSPNPLLIACLTYPILVCARGIKVHTSSDQTCYDVNHRVIDCPKKPWTVGKIVGVAVVVVFVVLIVVAAVIIKIRNKRAATHKYQSLPIPTQPQSSFVPPPQTSYAPSFQKPYSYSPSPLPQYTPQHQPQFAPPQFAPPQTSYAPPQGPPTHY